MSQNLKISLRKRSRYQPLNKENIKAEYLKYPLYNLEPSGQILNNFLRQGNSYNLSPREAQIIYVLNRTQFEPILKKKLEQGINIIAEDYVGTGIAWGIGVGVEQKFLEKINLHLLKEDLSILFDGKRFNKAIEKNHKYEIDKKLVKKVRKIHLKLRKKYGWKKINANLSVEKINEILWNKIRKLLN
ncbi:MAG: hypothetical protein GWO87_00110 [Xanthomonadaceae bacterium]|nr:hypothetical protein [Rhodospirillaceae bacterium]NIA17584.1 hypothetical protein [Xanthomonadaceae bacterium]